MRRCFAALRCISSAAVHTQPAFCPHVFGVQLCGGTALIRLPTAKRTTRKEIYRASLNGAF